MRVALRVKVLLQTDSGYLKDTGVTLFTLPLGQFYQSPPSPIPGDRGATRRFGYLQILTRASSSLTLKKRFQSPVADMFVGRDTYGQAQVCNKGHQEQRRPSMSGVFLFDQVLVCNAPIRVPSANFRPKNRVKAVQLQ